MMDDEAQQIMQSDLPNTLQLTWLAMWEFSESGVCVVPLSRIAEIRNVSRQAISQQVQRLREWGAVSDAGRCYRLSTSLDAPDGLTLRNEIELNYDHYFQTIAERDGRYCDICGSERDLQIDHVVPISEGGDNEMSNLRLLCKSCNLSR